MPSKNILKIDIPDTYYHVYARGSSRRDIFLDPKDKQVFLNLFKRYLSPKNSLDRLGQPYPNYSKDIELLCYCLMDNHFHLLVYQVDQGYMSMLMRGITLLRGPYS
jgi:REP element-mobilizing transposase RayT